MTATSADFWDRIAPDYNAQPVSDPTSYARKLAATRARLEPGMTVLEFGCGTGATALEHAPHVARIDATDVSDAMLAIGREKAARAGVDNVAFRRASIEDFDAPDGSYDVVLALNLLHLVPDLPAVFGKIHRLLRPGGLFVSSTGCLGDGPAVMRVVIPVMQWLGKAPWVSYPKSAALQREVEAAGFVIEEHWCHGRIPKLFLVARRP